MKKLLSVTAMVAIALSFTVQHAKADIVFDLTGVTYDGAGPTVLNVAGVAGTVIGVDYDFTIVPVGFSWSSELMTLISGPDGQSTTGGSAIQNPGLDTEFGGINTAAPHVVSIFNEPFLNGPATAGNWSLTLTDSFNDAGIDGGFAPGGTITIRTSVIPEPASAALISMIGLALISRRRR